MAKCQYCGGTLANNKPIALRCDNCGTTWCNNGQCKGSAGKTQNHSNLSGMCNVCKKRGSLKKV